MGPHQSLSQISVCEAASSKSDGRFFDRLSDSSGLGRLEFVEWIKDLLVKNQNHQVLIFDPYFEDAGIGLIVPNAGDQGDYIVFKTRPRPLNKNPGAPCCCGL